MKYRTRLILLSVGQVLGMSTLAFIGVHNIQTIRHQSAQATEQTVNIALDKKAPELAEAYANVELLLNADRDAYQALVAERDALRATEIETWTKAFESNNENAAQVKERVELASTSLPENALAIHQQVVEEHLKWSKASADLIQQIKSSIQSGAQASQPSTTYAAQAKHNRALFNQMRGSIDELVGVQEARIKELGQEFDLLREQATDTAQQIQATATSAYWQFVIVAVITSCVLIAAVILIMISITRGLHYVVTRLREIAEGDGDLTRRVNEKRRDEIGELGRAFNVFAQKVHDLVAAVRGSSTQVSEASCQITTCMNEMARKLGEEQARAANISAATDQMNSSIAEVASRAQEASDSSSTAGQVAINGGEVVTQTVEDIRMISEAVQSASTSIEGLLARSEQIGEVINVINEIADQTNLLALNAAIEAARAGEHGRGFAVVADEVRKLADRTTSATDEIAQSIGAIQNETSEAMQRMNHGRTRVESGVERASQAGEALKSIVESANGVSNIVSTIASASREQSLASDEVSHSVTEISNGMQHAVQAAEQSSHAIQKLSNKSEQLQALISKFKLVATDRRSNETAPPPPEIANRREDPRDESRALMALHGID